MKITKQNKKRKGTNGRRGIHQVNLWKNWKLILLLNSENQYRTFASKWYHPRDEEAWVVMQ